MNTPSATWHRSNSGARRVRMTAEQKRKQATGFPFLSMPLEPCKAFPGVDIDAIHYKRGAVNIKEAA